MQTACSLFPFSSQTVTGASSTFQFFFSEAFLGQHFEAVELEQGDPEPGDLFLFRLRSPTGRWCGAHVGVYCGHGEIIHFEGECLLLELRLKCAKRGCPAKHTPPVGGLHGDAGCGPGQGVWVSEDRGLGSQHKGPRASRSKEIQVWGY